jgi:acyl carrier protein
MNRAEIRTGLIHLLSAITGRALPEDEDRLLIEDFQLDSMGFIELILGIEERFKFTVPPQDYRIDRFVSVGHAVEYVVRRLADE